MPKATDNQKKMAHLKELADRPAEQVEYALELLALETRVDFVQAALGVLLEDAPPKARPVLIEKYQYYAEAGPQRDPGGYLRVDILKALRSLVQVADLPMLEQAALTYEYLPPGRTSEIGAGLRSAALVAMAEVDFGLAGYYCARLLTDPHTSKMSGEPALTAVKVLAAHRQFLPLYNYLSRPAEGISEVLGECLRSMTGLPPSLLGPLITLYGSSQDEIVLVGLFDLLQTHSTGASYQDFLLDFLTNTRYLNLFHYLVIGLQARRQTELLKKLAGILKKDKQLQKISLLEEAVRG